MATQTRGFWVLARRMRANHLGRGGLVTEIYLVITKQSEVRLLRLRERLNFTNATSAHRPTFIKRLKDSKLFCSVLFELIPY